MKYKLSSEFHPELKGGVVGIGQWLTQLFRGKKDNAEDPREVLDYSYERQLEMLTKVRRGIADVTTSRRRLELQLTQLRQSADRLQDQAVEAVDNGNDDLARDALSRRAAVTDQIDEVTLQRDGLVAEEEKLTTSAGRLQAKVDAFRTRKETVKANYTAAEAQTRIGEAVSGISKEMGDVGLAIQQAEDKTAEMQARAGAIDELLSSGALDDVTAIPGRSGMQAIDAARHHIDVEAQLAALKADHPTPAVDTTPTPRMVTDGTSESEPEANK